VVHLLNLTSVVLNGESAQHPLTSRQSHSLGLCLMGQEIVIDQGYIANAMLRAGFKSVHSKILDMGWGPMELDIARK